MTSGTFLRYQDVDFAPESLDLIRRADAILKEYDGAVTVRQLHYQFVARGLYANTKRNYDRLKEFVAKGRMAGLISWTAIEDVTRYLRGHTTHDDARHALAELRDSFHVDRWRDQPYRPVALIEKDALLGVIAPVCDELHVDYASCRGYSSASELWRLGQRLAGYVRAGQQPVVLHLGDHDPSGIDMTRDLRERLSLFAGVPVNVQRLALNMDQVERYGPPPNEARLSDARADDYVEEHGYSSWELDALAPDVLRGIIADAVGRVRDEWAWQAALAEEAEQRRLLDEALGEVGGGA